ncbi:putative lipoprotein [Hyphomonas polymorpha PS728]|uniref:Putative lipoprotein n=1 Tax=Hyphomonas polymorpha PS728 TaxID=1280954 RepID=A0A062V7G8_9PROT|nr:hypothetical protein [Hyphomonas polymorpha]KCZ98057.1 putative lipoprotein [Hyphomonas polymorpha PS728]
MNFRILAGAGTGLLASACSGGPQAGLDAAVIACGDTLAQNAAYVRQHVEAREEKLKVIRFASEEAMDAYNEVTDTFTVLGIDLVAMRNVIETERGLPDDTATYTFDHTTDEEATARIEAAKACAGPLLE